MLVVRPALWWRSSSIGVGAWAHPARAAHVHPPTVHAVPRSEPATHAATMYPSRRRDAFPRPRLLVRCQHRDGITTIRLGLIAQTLHLRPHLLEALPHPRSLGRVRPRGAGGPLRSQGIHLNAKRTPTLRRPTRDGGQTGHLSIGEIELAGLREKELCGVVHRAAAGSAHPARARHRTRSHLSAWLLRAERDCTRGADHRREK